MELKDLGTTIDLLYRIRDDRLDIERRIKDMKAREYELRNEILMALGNAGLAKASGALATASVRTATIPVVEDWDMVYRYVAEHDRFDLLQKRISTIAWRDLQESGTLVPGTTSVEDTDISLTKSSRG